MRRSKMMILTAFALLLLIAGWGCSGGGDGGGIVPAVPISQAQSSLGTGYWGMWQVSIDPNTNQVDILRLRQAELIVGVLPFMEPPALTNLTIDFDTLFIDDVAMTIAVDVLFTHPLVTPEGVFHGFDVRGVCFGPEVTNKDGMTACLNPAAFSDAPFGYVDGLLGTPNGIGQFADQIWDYKYFCDGLGLNDDLVTFMSDENNLLNRGIFSEGTTNSRHYDLDWTNSSHPFFQFNYAVLASYDWPVGDPPFDLDAFNLTSANTQEPFCANVTEASNTLNWWDGDGTGAVSLDVEVWDWQGNASNTVTVECVDGGLATTPFDTMSAGNTTKSDTFNFIGLAPVPISTADLDFLLVATSERTYGDSWFMDLMPPEHPMFGINVYSAWEFGVSVANVQPAGGLIKKAEGDLPETPYGNDVEFCVVGNGTGNAQDGVYFWGANYDVRYFPLDYSGPSASERLLQGAYGYSMYNLVGADTEMGSLEVDGSGGIMICSNATTNTWSYLYQANQPIFWWNDTSAALMNGLVLTYLWGDVYSDDIENEFAAYGVLWGHYETHQDNGYSGQDVEIVMTGAAYPYTSSAYGSYWDIDWGPLDESAGGSLDAEVSNYDEAYRFALDSSPQGLSGGHNVIFYYLENAPDDNTVEAMSSVKTSLGSATTSLLTHEGSWVGTVVDIAVLPIFGDDPDATGNWLCVLEDNGDSTFQVALFEQDGTLVARSASQTGDVLDANSDPYGLDIDVTNNEMHVWVDDAGTLRYFIFEWSP